MATKNSGDKLAGLYHKGQDKIWDGKKYLKECIDRHGGINISEENADALHNIFMIILWGELAAWKISSALATELDDNSARMAATSQAHDEARHFYVMKDYLDLLGKESPQEDLNRHADRFLSYILDANHISKKLLGMQLMVEPLALTLFKIVREKNIDPVLTDLLLMFERDEARHVAFGTLHLPAVLKDMSIAQRTDLWIWQFLGYMKQFKILYSLEDSFEQLGIEPRSVYESARKKQLHALNMMAEEMGIKYPLAETVMKFSDARYELGTSSEKRSYLKRLIRATEKVIA
ncbi:MAG: hypothetical protein CME70_13995 [Halobacteriovorax sp.]|nr:hypothetical protein [Halobacteriovorax sp.]